MTQFSPDYAKAEEIAKAFFALTKAKTYTLVDTAYPRTQFGYLKTQAAALDEGVPPYNQRAVTSLRSGVDLLSETITGEKIITAASKPQAEHHLANFVHFLEGLLAYEQKKETNPDIAGADKVTAGEQADFLTEALAKLNEFGQAMQLKVRRRER